MRDRRASLALGLAVLVAGCVAHGPRPSDGRRVGATATPAAWSARPVRPALTGAERDELGDLALLWQARDAQAQGDLDAVRQAATTLTKRYRDSVWAGEIGLLAGLAARRQGDLSDARRWLADALPLLDETGAAWRRTAVVLAELTAASGDDVTALRLAASLREKHPRGLADRRARRLTDRIFARRPDLMGDFDRQLAEASLRLRENDPAWALAAAARLAAAGGEDGARALLVRARAERALGRAAEAEATCRLVSRMAGPDLAAEALALAGRWRWNADDDAAARTLFEQAVARAPDSPAGLDATYALTRIAQEAGQWQQAARGYARVADASDPDLARAGRWGGAWIRYLAGDWHAAAEAFARLASRDDADSLAARYWEARARQRAGDPRGNAQLHALTEEEPDTYYGWAARRRLGYPQPPPTSVTPPAPPVFPAALTGVHARRALALLRLGLPRLARREVDALRGTADPELIVRAYHAVGAPEAAIRLAAKLPEDEGTRRARYPLGYWAVVREAAHREGLDPLLVQALIRQESAFAARAVSAADAYGLMQLLPSTAAHLAAERGQPPPDRVRLTDVRVNVELGTALLRRLLAQYGGSEIKALAAYNAGDGAVRKWEGRYGQRAEDEFVELISFRETKRYVKIVLENYQVYRVLYADNALASSLGSPPKAPFDMMTMTSPGRAEPAR